MNKRILALILFGVALAMMHMPEVMITVGIITGLVMVTTKLFWSVLQSFSGPVEDAL
ncbi:MAG: hypothetical protein AAFO06_25215 [Cyanobacteria bacterium J06597_16]